MKQRVFGLGVLVLASLASVACQSPGAEEEAVSSDEAALDAVLGQQTDIGTLPEQCDSIAPSGPLKSSAKAWENWSCTGPTNEFGLVVGQGYGVQRVSVRANFAGGREYDLGLLERFPEGGIAGPKAEWLGQLGSYSLVFRYGVRPSASNPKLASGSFFVLAKVTNESACVYNTFPSADRNAVYAAIRSPEFQAFSCPAARPAPPPSAECGILRAGQGIPFEGAITSCEGLYSLQMQGDGNLVLYRNADGTALWHSHTNGSAGRSAYMAANGSFSVVDETWSPNPIWSSEDRTISHPGAFLAVQDDGNLVIYDAQSRPLWASGTQQ